MIKEKTAISLKSKDCGLFSGEFGG